MAQAKAISLKQLSAAVQAAVKSASHKHPKLQVEAQGIALGYLIWGIPVPDIFTVAETQAIANEVASHVGPVIAGGATGIAERAATHFQGAVHSVGGHVIIGIPAVDTLLLKE